MRARLLALAAVALAALLSCRGPALRPPSTVTFRFAPPAGTTLEQEVTTLRDGGIDPVRRTHERTVTRSFIEFRTRPEGYLVTATLLATETMRDGSVSTDASREALRGLPISYRIRSDGTLEGVDGLGALADKVEGLREQDLVAQETEEWNDRVVELAGRMVSIGESFDGSVSVALPNGESIVCRTRTVIRRFEPCGRRRCVRVEQRFHSDPSALEGTAPAAPPSAPGASGTLRRLIDPDTMLVYAEELVRNLAVEMQGEKGELHPVSVRETRRYAFQYR